MYFTLPRSATFIPQTRIRDRHFPFWLCFQRKRASSLIILTMSRRLLTLVLGVNKPLKEKKGTKEKTTTRMWKMKNALLVSVCAKLVIIIRTLCTRNWWEGEGGGGRRLGGGGGEEVEIRAGDGRGVGGKRRRKLEEEAVVEVGSHNRNLSDMYVRTSERAWRSLLKAGRPGTPRAMIISASVFFPFRHPAHYPFLFTGNEILLVLTLPFLFTGSEILLALTLPFLFTGSEILPALIDDLRKSRGLHSVSAYRHGLYIQVQACGCSAE